LKKKIRKKKVYCLILLQIDLPTRKYYQNSGGGCHDWADAQWIVIRGPLRGHDDTPFGRPTPGQPVGRPGAGHPHDVFGVFSYYQLVMLFLNMVCLTVT
jgi:hypothetical protein